MGVAVEEGIEWWKAAPRGLVKMMHGCDVEERHPRHAMLVHVSRVSPLGVSRVRVGEYMK